MMLRRDSASSVLGTLETLLSIKDLGATTAAELIARSVELNKSVLDGNTPTTIKGILDGGVDDDHKHYECAKRILNRFIKKFSKTVEDVCALVAAEAGLLAEPMFSLPECKQQFDSAGAVAELALLKALMNDLIDCDQTWLTDEASESLKQARSCFGVAKLVLKDQLPFQADVSANEVDDSKTNGEASATSEDKHDEKRLGRVDDTDAFIVENLQLGHGEAVKRILNNLSADTFKMHELEALYKHSFLLDRLDYAKIMLETIPEVESIMDIRVHEIYFKLLRKCLSQLPAAQRDEAIAFAFEKRGVTKLKKLGEVQVAELKEQWAGMILSPERFAATPTPELTELIIWTLIVDPSTYLVDLLMTFMSERMQPHLPVIVRVLHDLRSIANLQTGGRPLLHSALDRVARQWTGLWTQHKPPQKPPPLDRFGWLVQVMCDKQENEPGVLSAGLVLNDLLLPAAVEGNSSGYSSGLVAAAITHLLASEQIDIDLNLSSRCADVWDDAAPTSVGPDTVEAPKIVHLMMQWYIEPSKDDVQERRRCSLLTRLFASLDNRLRGREWPPSTVDWLKSKLSKHSWRVRHFLIKHLMAESLGKQWPDEIPEKLRRFLDDPQAQSAEDAIDAVKELLSLMSVTTEPIAVDVVERLVEALPSKIPKQTMLVALSKALPALWVSHRSSEHLPRLLSLLMDKVTDSPSALAHDYLSAVQLVDTVDLVLAQSLNAAEERDKGWLTLLDWFVERIAHLAAAIDDDASLTDQLRRIRYSILELNIAPIKFSSVEATPASMSELYERLASGAGRDSSPPKPLMTVAMSETEPGVINEVPLSLSTLLPAHSASNDSNAATMSHGEDNEKSARSKAKTKKEKDRAREKDKKNKLAKERRGSAAGNGQLSAAERDESKQLGQRQESEEITVVEVHPPNGDNEPLRSAAGEDQLQQQQHQQQQQRPQHERKRLTCFNCQEEGHYSKDCPKRNNKCHVCGQEGHRRKDCPNTPDDRAKHADNSPQIDALPYNSCHEPERPMYGAVNPLPPSDNHNAMFMSAFTEDGAIAASIGPAPVTAYHEGHRSDIPEGVHYGGHQFIREFSQRTETAPATGGSDHSFNKNCYRCNQPGHIAAQCSLPQREGIRPQDSTYVNSNRRDFGTGAKFNDVPPPEPCSCGEWHWKRNCPRLQNPRNVHGNRQDSTASQNSGVGGGYSNYSGVGGGSHRGGQRSITRGNNGRGGVNFGGEGKRNYLPPMSGNKYNSGGNYRPPNHQNYNNGASHAGGYQQQIASTVISHGPPMHVDLSAPPPHLLAHYPNPSIHNALD
uniref:CCHC-type domain-containing protein n=1 Tax=Plectus sambesii TaxID=2011161 RepID=A0A914WPE7_9BILA